MLSLKKKKEKKDPILNSENSESSRRSRLKIAHSASKVETGTLVFQTINVGAIRIIVKKLSFKISFAILYNCSNT